MVDSEDPTGHALELARSATPAMARRRTALAAVARPAAEVAGLLLVEVVGSPRARAAALGLARSLAGWRPCRRRVARRYGEECDAVQGSTHRWNTATKAVTRPHFNPTAAGRSQRSGSGHRSRSVRILPSSTLRG